MNAKKSIILLFISLFFSNLVFSQGELDEEVKIFYRNEKSWAFSINTNGLGGGFRKGNRINAFRKFIWEVDMNYVRHPKEIKISSNSYQLSQYVFGKVNFAWETRGAVGFQHELYRKIDKSGIAIRFFYEAGPSIILLKPIYYEVYVTDHTEPQKFDPSTYQIITGRSSFFMGLDELKVDPGVYLKSGFSFDYSKQDAKLQAIEIGGVASAFLNEVELMASKNTRFLLSLFISFRWGKIYSGGNMENLDYDSEEP